MKLSTLLTQRGALLHRARLANLAFAYRQLGDFIARLARAGLRGEFNLKSAAPDTGRYTATLTALAGSQSVVEEHFTDEDLMDLADTIAFVTGSADFDLTFRREDLSGSFLAPLRRELERAGVALGPDPQPAREANRDDSIR